MSTSPTATLYFVVPNTIDDPDRVSGGNVYDQRVRDGLRQLGWDVRMVLLGGGGERTLAQALSRLPDAALVLVDGLIAVRESDVFVGQSSRLRLVVLAHMVASLLVGPTGDAGDPAEVACRERSALGAAHLVIATSSWTRSELITRNLAEPYRIVVAQPGTDLTPATIGSAAGGRLLCVGVVARHKGQDLLVRALSGLADIAGWSCRIVGSLQRYPDFVAELRADLTSVGVSDRVTFTGVLTGTSLADAYGQADLVVVPSRSESYGMVVAESLSRGIPVVATQVGGIPEALVRAAAGVVIPPDDPWALGVVLRQWCTSPTLRSDLKAEALASRAAVRPWSATIGFIDSTLDHAARLGSAAPA